MEMEFEWDPDKEVINSRKHGISFHIGATVFGDIFSLTFPDIDHSEEEDRFITIGYTSDGKLIVVSHTDRAKMTRIISARLATPKERRFYEKDKHR